MKRGQPGSTNDGSALMRKSFWRSIWFSLLRSRKDKRARKAILAIALFLIWLVTEAWVVFALPAREGQGLFQLVFNGFVVASGFAVSLLIRRVNQREDDLLNFSITGRNPRQFPNEVSPRVRDYLADRAVIVASLLARGGSEIYLVAHEVPIGTAVVTRQVQNTLLRRAGLWEKLDSSEIAVVTLADGLWNEEQRTQVITWCEQLRLLRWVFQIDTEVIPLSHNPRVDYSLTRQLLQSDTSTVLRSPIRPPWDIRIERDNALAYTARVVAELKARSLIEGGDELDWSTGLREASVGASSDFLAGSKTVEELDDQSLRLLGLVAHSRAEYGGYLVDLLSQFDLVPFPQWANSGHHEA